MGDDKPPESVMVAVRCRPMNQREIDQKEGKIVVIKEGGYCALEPPEGAKREFSYDYAYDEDSVQPDVYRNLGAPLLSKAFDGWNGTIFAYGQTGSGKSFSMTGSKEKPGIIPQLNKAMFERIEETQTSNPERKFLVTCSFLEIYNEARPFRPRCARRAWRWCVAATARPRRRRLRRRRCSSTCSTRQAVAAPPSRARTRTSTLRSTRCSACTWRGCSRSRRTRAMRSQS